MYDVCIWYNILPKKFYNIILLLGTNIVINIAYQQDALFYLIILLQYYFVGIDLCVIISIQWCHMTHHQLSSEVFYRKIYSKIVYNITFSSQPKIYSFGSYTLLYRHNFLCAFCF